MTSLHLQELGFVLAVEATDRTVDRIVAEDDTPEHNDDDDENEHQQRQEKIAPSVSDETDSICNAYFKLIGGRECVPFSLDSKQATAVEELRLFNELSVKYDRYAAPSSANGYNAFLKEWDALSRTRRNGYLFDDTVVLVFRKSLAMLYETYDKLKERKLAAAEASIESTARADAINDFLVN